MIAARFGDTVAYLGQASRTVAQEFYVAVSLDDALNWLHEESAKARQDASQAALAKATA